MGIGSIAKASTVGKIGGLAMVYFLVMSSFALIIGLVVGNIIHPGEGLNIAGATYEAAAEPRRPRSSSWASSHTFFSAFTGGSILQVLFIALLVGFALQGMGERGARMVEGIRNFQVLVFRILGMILWLAPIGAFGAIAAVVGKTGFQAVISLGILMGAFYLTCFLFIAVVLGTLLYVVTRVNIFTLMKYLGASTC